VLADRLSPALHQGSSKPPSERSIGCIGRLRYPFESFPILYVRYVRWNKAEEAGDTMTTIEEAKVEGELRVTLLEMRKMS
jgi:hypothetical protein